MKTKFEEKSNRAFDRVIAESVEDNTACDDGNTEYDKYNYNADAKEDSPKFKAFKQKVADAERSII